MHGNRPPRIVDRREEVISNSCGDEESDVKGIATDASPSFFHTKATVLARLRTICAGRVESALRETAWSESIDSRRAISAFRWHEAGMLVSMKP
jgi:hypothetical protein